MQLMALFEERLLEHKMLDIKGTQKHKLKELSHKWSQML